MTLDILTLNIGSIRFAGDIPFWFVAVIGIMAVAAVFMLYLRESRSLVQPYRYLLPGLRSAAIVMALMILAGPIWNRRQVVGTLGRVVFAIDTSQSMSLSDSQADTSRDARLTRATDLLLGDQSTPGWLEEISKTHSIDVVTFDSQQGATLWSSEQESDLPQSFDLSATGRSTNLSAPIQAALSMLNLDSQGKVESETTAGNDSVRRAAVVLMTDGRETAVGESSASDLSKRLARSGASVHALGLGSTDEPPDVGVVNVARPETVAAKGKLAGMVTVKRFGDSKAPVSVRIEHQGNTVWSESIEVGSGGRRNVPFEIDVQPLVNSLVASRPRGIERFGEVLQLSAIVETEGQDYSPTNNSLDFRVAAATRNRRILIVDGSSRWETRYLKNLFVRDPAWQTDLVLFGQGTPNPTLPRGDEPGQFPDTPESISQYDAIILGDVDANQFDPADQERLLRFVSSGGGLILVDGRFGGLQTLAESNLKPLMPIRYLDRSPLVEVEKLSPTVAGLEQPALGLIDQSSQLQTFWQRLPEPKWCAHVELAEGAESWADAIVPSRQPIPWLATRMYGSGRVFYFASDQTWRWRYKVADKFHARFWNQMLVASIEPPYAASDQFVSLGTDKVEYGVGESISVRARLKDMQDIPVPDATVDAMVLQNEQIVATVPLTVDNPLRGTYAGVVPALSGGEYTVRIRASGFDESALLANTPIWVTEENNSELVRMSLDEDSLRQITSAGGGNYVHESDAQTMLEQIRPLSSGTILETDTVMWQSYWWFWIIIALLAAEWWLRKRAGLV